jgi:hypothetical protein
MEEFYVKEQQSRDFLIQVCLMNQFPQVSKEGPKVANMFGDFRTDPKLRSCDNNEQKETRKG